MNNILVFYPHNPFVPCHGSHQRALQQLNDLRSNYNVILASTVYSSDTPWPGTILQLEQLGNQYEKLRIVLFEYSFLGFIARCIYLSLRCVSLVFPFRAITVFASSVNQALLLIWFSLVSFRFRPIATIIHYTYWSRLVYAWHSGVKVIELHDLLPVNHYLAALVGDLLDSPFLPLRGNHEVSVGYIDSAAQLPSHVVADIRDVVDDVNKFDLAWMISDREQNLLISLGMKTSSHVIYPLISCDSSNKSKSLPPILPIGPNPFNSYSLRQFVRDVLPLLNIQDVVEDTVDFEIQVTGRFWRDRSIYLPSPLKYYGVVDNYLERLSQSNFMIAPTSVGTGQQIKIFEALACGTPVIAYSSAVPLDILACNPSIIAVNTPCEFASAISQLIRDKQLLDEYTKLALDSSQRQSYRKTSFDYCHSLGKVLDHHFSS